MTVPQRFRRSPSTRFRKVFEEGLLLDQEVARLHVLNSAAAFLWDLLAQPRTSDELLNALLQEFDVDPETARRDIREFLDQALSAGLLEVQPPPEA